MANKKYVGMFVTPKIRKAIKQRALTNNRTMIEELEATFC